MYRLSLALVLLAALVPLTTPTAHAECYPAADGTATAIGVGDGTIYHKTWGRTTRYHEIWIEENGIPGLQTDTGMACGAPRDRQYYRACIGAGCAIGA